MSDDLDSIKIRNFALTGPNGSIHGRIDDTTLKIYGDAELLQLFIKGTLAAAALVADTPGARISINDGELVLEPEKP